MWHIILFFTLFVIFMLFILMFLQWIISSIKLKKEYTDIEMDEKIVNKLNHAIFKYRSRIVTSKNILVIFPAYNEEENLSHVLKDKPSKILDHAIHYLVVDDGSVDNTSQVAKKEGAFCIRIPKNMGGGYALQVGFFFARKLKIPYVVTMDADGQHQFLDMENLITPVFENKADIVIGSRFQAPTHDTGKFRTMGIKFFSQILSFILKKKITDCSNSYRAFNIESIKRLKLIEKKHHTAELIIQAVRKKLILKEVPINIRSRLSGKSKKGFNFMYAFRFAQTILISWRRS